MTQATRVKKNAKPASGYPGERASSNRRLGKQCQESILVLRRCLGKAGSLSQPRRSRADVQPSDNFEKQSVLPPQGETKADGSIARSGGTLMRSRIHPMKGIDNHVR